jgi:hypothetical protein
MNWVEAIKAFLRDMRLFSRMVMRRPLRSYQLAPARAIVDSVLNRRGLTFAVVMSRQAGKNELSAQLEAYLMNLFQGVGGASLVKASPTYKPQTITSRMRLLDRLDNDWNRDAVRRAAGYIVRLGRCRCCFFSAHHTANVVGATANVLLECDEAQDVDPDKWSKDFAPMGASTNVTTVFYGTVWTRRTLLAQVMRRLRQQELRDGVQRVFVVPWEQVAQEVPAYGAYVRGEMARLGPDHPVIQTQYKLQAIDDAGGMFPPERLARMRGDHRRQRRPLPDETYAITIDVAGEDEQLERELQDDEALRAAQPRRDSTVLTVFRVDLAGIEDPLLGLPRYEVVDRHWWTGRKHSDLYAAICDLIETWRAAWVVVDATGLGAGLASFLARRYGTVKDDPSGLLIPFVFSSATKSDLGWEFLSLVETGRYKEYADDSAADTRQFWREVAACQFEVLPGPGRRMRWGVDDPAVHDDMLISAALVARLDHVAWGVAVETEIVPPGEGRDGAGF